jgi:hypothetical protein
MQHITVFIDLQNQLNMFRTNVCPKHVELILKINKYCYLSHLAGLDFITLPIAQYFPLKLSPQYITTTTTTTTTTAAAATIVYC